MAATAWRGETPETRILGRVDEDVMVKIARALGGSEAGEVGALLYALNQKLDIPLALADIGLPENGPADAAQIACASPYYNPRPFEQGPIEALLTRAMKGLAPA